MPVATKPKKTKEEMREEKKQKDAAGKQFEFKEFPERTPLGKKVIEFIEARNQFENKKNVFDRVKEELAGEFKKAHKAGIKVNRIQVGRTVVTYSQSEKDIIKVQKAESR